MSEAVRRREEERFQKAIPAAHTYVEAVHNHYIACGWQSEMKSNAVVRPSFAERYKYGDDYDLRIRPYESHRWLDIEVKSRPFNFTCILDFPYKAILIDRFEKVQDYPCDYYINVSKDKKYAAIAERISTQEHWIENNRFDRTKGYHFHSFECPVTLATFFPLLP